MSTKREFIDAFEARMEALRVGHARKYAWSDETIALVTRLAAEGIPVLTIAKRANVQVKTLRDRAPKLGIDLIGVRKERQQAGDAVLRELFPTERNMALVHERWRAATAENRSLEAMIQVAKGRLKLRRPFETRQDQMMRANAARVAQREAERRAKAIEVQKLIDAGMSRPEIVRCGHVARETLRAMKAQGMVVFPAFVPKPKPAPAPKVAKQPKPPKVRTEKREEPKPRPAANTFAFYIPPVVTPPKPPAPVHAETVEEFLARGGKVSRCPAVVLVPSQATTTDADRAAIREHQARQEAEFGGTWVQRKNAIAARNRARQREQRA